VRLLLVGAFPYPHHQGSQIYFQEQAIALRRAGAEVDLLTYGRGTQPAPDDLDRWRALDGFAHYKTPAWTAPGSMGSGPGWGKPLADASLFMTLRDAIASKLPQSGQYDAILTHNAEACVLANLSGGWGRERRIPIIYCVHTLLENELSTYFKSLKTQEFLTNQRSFAWLVGGLRRRLRKGVDTTGAAVDRWLAKHADGWIALTQSSHSVMRRFSTRPGSLIPPSIPDPRHRLGALDPRATSEKHGLPYKDFYLYSGNLDGYQELELLARANQQRRAGDPKIVLASHDRDVVLLGRENGAGLEGHFVESGAEMLALLAAARASIVARRAAGGFPIKLVNSLAVGTAPVTFLEREWGLTDGQNAQVVAGDRPVAGLAEAIDALDRSPDLAARLGVGARALYETNHRPQAAAEQTLALIRKSIARNACQFREGP
jgi:glycosyltransferase involved in cell wall biosynthesis